MPLRTIVSLLPQEAPPEDAQQAPGAFGNFLIPLVAIFMIFWFVMIRPERKQRKLRQEMLAALAKGDRVMTTSGMIATVVSIQEDVVTLQAAEGVRLKFTRAAIQNILDDKGGEEKGG